MFKRDARDKVRQMGGIMASSAPLIQEVARFQYGGGVNFGALEQRFTGTPGTKRLRSEVAGPGVKTIFSKQDPMYSVKKPMPGLFGQTSKTEVDSDPLSIARYPGQTFKSDERFDVNTQELVARQNLSRIIGKAKSLGILDKPTVSKSEIEEFIKNETGTPFFEASEALINSLSGPSDTRYGVLGKELAKYALLPGTITLDILKKTNEFLLEAPKDTVEGILAGEIPMPEGVDIIALGANSNLGEKRLKELGVPIDKINAMKKVREEGLGPLERKVTIKDDISSSLKKAELGQSPGAMGGKLAEDQGEGKYEKPPTTAEEREAFKAEDTKEIRNEQDQSAQFDAAELSKKVANGKASINEVKKQVSDVVKSGAGVNGALKQLMKEFTDNAPEYKGLDRGLAIAKIGFAMAAGESPNAITNIAKALSDGADMFIEDNAKRDAFNRQVKLSALQYGLGEVSKQRAQARTDARTRTDFAVGDKPIQWKGTTYQPGETISISNKDYFENGGKLPAGLQTMTMYTSNQAALNARLKSAATLAAKNLEMKTMNVKDQKTFVDDFAGLHRKASKAETAGTLLETVIKTAPDVVGFKAAGKSAGAMFAAAFGYDAPKGWSQRDLSINLGTTNYEPERDYWLQATTTGWTFCLKSAYKT